MADTRALLDKISQFRARLEQMPLLLSYQDPNQLTPQQLSHAVNRIAGFVDRPPVQPVQLTARATRLLTEARELVMHQKQLADDRALVGPDAEHDPLARFHRGTVGLTDATLRLASAFPPGAEAQLRMCDGFEQMLHVIRHRLGVLNHALAVRRSDQARVHHLADRLAAVHDGRVVHIEQFLDLAEVILDDARQGARLRWQEVNPHTQGVPLAVAAHAYNVAQVLARLAPHDFEWASKPTLIIVAALLMDVGLLDRPADQIAPRRTLSGESLRDYEAHPRRAAELVQARLPETGPLAEVLVAHHERIDGTGFPNGFRGDTIPTAARFLAVADEYVRRYWHHDGDPRMALTDTLLAAEHGQLDRDFAEYLLHLSFYPVGTIVELNDGRLAVVVAVHANRTNPRLGMRPVVAVLTDRDERAVPRPEFVDLAAAQVGSIVRAVPRAERNAKLGEWYPDLCCS